MIRPNGRMRGWAGLVLALALAGWGCAGAPRIEVPSTLPNVAQEDFLTLRWALQREGGTARAVGLAEPSTGTDWDATLDLFGVDRDGRIVSRGSRVVRPGFAPGPTPFEVALAETGREAEFQLHVTRSRMNSRPGR
jgi:hypothetical protein